VVVVEQAQAATGAIWLLLLLLVADVLPGLLRSDLLHPAQAWGSRQQQRC